MSVHTTDDFRTERDSLGPVRVPAGALWGAHTQRALTNFTISGIPVGHHRELVRALGLVKKAAAVTNADLGLIPVDVGRAIAQACDIVIRGDADDAFPVDVVQGGAGTSTNMNANEVIANLALDVLGLGARVLRPDPPDRAREQVPVDQRRLPDRRPARPAVRHRRAARAPRPSLGRLRRTGPRIRVDPEGRPDPVAGRSADDPGTGVHCIRRDASGGPATAARGDGPAARVQSRRHRNRDRHHRRSPVPRACRGRPGRAHRHRDDPRRGHVRGDVGHRRVPAVLRASSSAPP